MLWSGGSLAVGTCAISPSVHTTVLPVTQQKVEMATGRGASSRRLISENLARAQRGGPPVSARPRSGAQGGAKASAGHASAPVEASAVQLVEPQAGLLVPRHEQVVLRQAKQRRPNVCARRAPDALPPGRWIGRRYNRWGGWGEQSRVGGNASASAAPP